MTPIETLEDLHALYGTPGDAALRKVADRLTPEYARWIERSRFCILSTVGPEGTDASPRGDDGPVVSPLDDRHLAMPDWRGNQRLDSLRNILRDPRVSLMFMVPGSNNVIRINGRAIVTADKTLRDRLGRGDIRPATVIVIEIKEVYSQCARALVRSRLWTAGEESQGLPTVGQILAAMTDDEVGGERYDAEWAGRAIKTLW
jgi:PPOX class probable FMN-dependent enzyme